MGKVDQIASVLSEKISFFSLESNQNFAMRVFSGRTTITICKCPTDSDLEDDALNFAAIVDARQHADSTKRSLKQTNHSRYQPYVQYEPSHASRKPCLHITYAPLVAFESLALVLIRLLEKLLLKAVSTI